MKKILLIVTAAYLTLNLSACNTIRGLGTDITNAGQAISNASERAQNKF